jgi:hypothetical protein
MHAFLREDYLNQVQRVSLTHALKRRTPSEELAYCEAKSIYRQGMRRRAAAAAVRRPNITCVICIFLQARRWVVTALKSEPHHANKFAQSSA